MTIQPGHKQLFLLRTGILERSAAYSFAFLASAAASSDLVRYNLPAYLQSLPTSHLDIALSLWSQGHDNPPPSGNAACIQKSWDAPKHCGISLENAPDDLAQVRLLAASAKESSAWLHTIPISSLSLRMDDNTFRIAVGLRLGSTFCRPHTCQHCGVKWTISPLMGSVIEKVRGATITMRHQRDSIQALASVCIPSSLEPSGLDCSDGKWLDGVIMIPWKNGKPYSMRCNLPRRSRPVLPLLCHQ